MVGRLRTLAVPLLAIAAILGSGAWMVSQGQGVGGWGMGSDGSGFGTMGGAGNSMMGGAGNGGGVAGTAVVDLAGARAQAQVYATDLRPGLSVGEVMRFDRQYYAELVEADGSLATEVLIDPASGDVQIELGPARMWNTRYGMMARGATEQRIGADEAQKIADRWLADQTDGAGLTAGSADAFPGYYTLHTLRGGEVVGMLSVNSTSGDVWYHSWHGTFVAMSEAP